VARVLGRSLLALALFATAGLITWRVLAPAEVLAPATGPYPAPVRRGPGVLGELTAAPLIVAERIRVYAGRRQVKADAPVDGKAMYTARWSFRRWPQRVAGVAAVGPTVLSRWSDGEVVAIDGRSGTIVWRVDGPPAPDPAAGATTVWAPPGLVTAGTTVLLVGGGRVHALDAATGAVRWQGACRTEAFATEGGQVICGDVARRADTGAVLSGWPGGPYTGLGCAASASRCRALRDAAGRGWLVDGTAPRRAIGLDVPASVVFRDLALDAGSSGVVARSAASNGELWRWAGPRATVLGGGPNGVNLLTADRQLVALDPQTGAERVRFPLDATDDPVMWHVAGGYVALAFPDRVVLAAI
jgi:outer membrane protein assembly factor BamB